MKYFVVIFFALLVSQAVFAEDPASSCDADACQIDNNCRCSNSDSPLDGDLSEWPQLVSITFDDAIIDRVYDDYIIPLLGERTNPDGANIGATFFVPHEFTNYQHVQDLYSVGFEIGVHSITKDSNQDYWRHATEDTLVAEFQGQKHIISKFANIPEEAILGVRTPQLQLAGNRSIKAYQTAGLTYDSSWPSLPSARMFPYTLDYASTESCLLGAECPNEAFPGFWILPINDFTNKEGTACSVIGACNVNGTADEIADWLTGQVNAVRNTTKTPLTLLMNSGWLNGTENSQEGFVKFMDNMDSNKDVFFVKQKQILDWIKSPVKISDFKTDSEIPGGNCDPQNCIVQKGTSSYNFKICVGCPEVYPWINNPDGNKQ